jgi:hypothetical protein
MIGRASGWTSMARAPHSADQPLLISCAFEMSDWRPLAEDFFVSLEQFQPSRHSRKKTGEGFAAMILLAGSPFALK